jgi:succinate dehydrogenase/fumarate reductase-like Fe-S protein
MTPLEGNDWRSRGTDGQSVSTKMTDAEKIRTRHKPVQRRGHNSMSCPRCAHRQSPCDVVRLVDALEGAIVLLGRLTFAFDRDDNRHADLRAEQEKLKAILREVAGGDDAE